MAYPNGTVPTTATVHPTPIYEIIVMGGFTLLLWRWRDRWRPGTLIAIYLVGAGLERFLVEFVRRNPDAASASRSRSSSRSCSCSPAAPGSCFAAAAP